MRHTENGGEVWYGIHEFYRPDGYSVKPVDIVGFDMDDIKWMLEAMLEDIEKYGVKDYE